MSEVTPLEPIAIVGIALLVSDAHTLDGFRQNLRQARDSVRPPSDVRIAFSNLDPSDEYPIGGFLDRIDLFDNQRFGISLREATIMDPQHRITLELVLAAVENAGYPMSALAGTPTAVLLSAGRPDYARLLPEADPLALLGNGPGALPGRIAHFLGLEGPAVAIDAGCSSSLVALHYACTELRQGEITCALAGGVSIHPSIQPRSAYAAFGEVMASDGRCRAFDVRADGTAEGEGGAIVMLKRLSQAQSDGDSIHAVLSGSAINHNGRRSNTLPAPSTTAQAAVIKAAWRAAGVSGNDIGMIEAHGSGTRLGDAIEADALAAVLRTEGPPDKSRSIGSVKTNIGHLDHAAGIVSLVKAVLAVRYGEIYPSLNFSAPNSLIDLGAMPFDVATEHRAWTFAGDKRRAGVSSFSLVGTNAHVVVEEPPGRRREHPDAGESLVTVSARTSAMLHEACLDLANAADLPTQSLADVAFTMNTGREHHAYRASFVVDSVPALIAELRSATADRRSDPAPERRAVWLFEDQLDTVLDLELSRELTTDVPGAKPLGEALTGLNDDSGAWRVPAAVQLALWRVVADWGVPLGAIVGRGRGNLAARAFETDLALDVTAVQDWERPVAMADRESALHALQRLQDDGPVQFVALARGELSVVADEIVAMRTGSALEVLAEPTRSGLLRLCSALYNAGFDIDWQKFHRHMPGRRVELPSAPLTRVRCWPYPVGQCVRAPLVGSAVVIPAGGGSSSQPAATDAPAGTVASLGVPVDHVAAQLADIWRRVLGVTEELQPDANYFDYGGNSVTAIEVLEAVDAAFRVQLPVADLYEHSTLLALAEHVAAQTSVPFELRQSRFANALPLVPFRRTTPLPLSFGQERLWFLDRLHPGTAAYNIPVDLHLHGDVNVQALHAALAKMVERHEVLRSRFDHARGIPYVEIDDTIEVNLRQVTIDPSSASSASLREIVTEEARLPFDLVTGPVFRCLLVRLQHDHHVLVLTVHHIVDDGWSPAIIAREFSELYSASCEGRRADLEPLPIQYIDYAYWQKEWMQGVILDRQLAYWKNQLAGAPPLELPKDRPRPPQPSFRGGVHRFRISSTLAVGLRHLARDLNSTLFTTILAAFNVLLARYSLQDDVVVATPSAGRNRPETRGLIGFFNNALALRSQIIGNPSFDEFVARTRGVVLQALDNQDLPFEKIVDAVEPTRDLSRDPLSQVVYIHQHIPALDYSLPGLRIGASTFGHEQAIAGGLTPGTAKFDLTLGIWDVRGVDDLACSFEFSSDLFDRETIERLAENFVELLSACVREPTRPVRNLELIGPSDRRLMAAAGERQAWAQQPRLDVGLWNGSTVPDCVTWQANHRPDAVAIRAREATWTYAELDARANGLAHALIASGVRPGARVGVAIGPSRDLPVGVLGVMKAGAAYVPLDPAYPVKRLEMMAKDAEVTAVVVARSGHPNLELGSIPQVEVDVLGGYPVTPPTITLDPRALAYITYTSGSTGAPKGVAVSHGAVVEQLRAMLPVTEVDETDVVLAATSPSFDPSVIELFQPLAVGASIVVLPRVEVLNGRSLTKATAEFGITLMQATPTIWQSAISSGWAGGPHVRALTGGEVLTPSLAKALSARCRTVTNLYGPTEATVWSTAWRVGPDAVSVPIGYPIGSRLVRIVDHEGQDVPVGVPGEVWLGGSGLADGYWGRDELTAERFIPANNHQSGQGGSIYRTGDLGRLRPDGALEFIGRLDDQVKIRGCRVEPAEVEALLEAHVGIQQAVVIPDGANDLASLVAFVRLAEGVSVAPSDLLAVARGQLPDYMTPRHIQIVDSFPLTQTGKVDRTQLHAPARDLSPANAAFVAPRDSFEITLCDLWSETLGVEQVGVDDDFFELGGHSLLAVELLAKVEEIVDSEVPLELLFQGATVARLAAALRGPASSRTTAPLVPLVKTGSGDPFFCVHPSGGNVLCYYHFAHSLDVDRPIYGVQSVGLSGGESPLDSIELMAARYLSEIRSVQPHGPYHIGGWSMGGLIAFEMARSLRGDGEEIGLLALLDASLSPPVGRVLRDEAEQLMTLVATAVAVPTDLKLDGDEEARLESALAFARDAGVVPAGVRSAEVRSFLKVLTANEDATRAFNPKTYGGDALLVRSADGTGNFEWDRHITGEVITRVVPGDHFSMIFEHGDAVADAVRPFLQHSSSRPIHSGHTDGETP